MNDGGQVFPNPTYVELNADHDKWGDISCSEGITKREYFAAMMMAGFCSNPAVFASNSSNGWSLVNCDEDVLARYCLQLADALLERLKE